MLLLSTKHNNENIFIRVDVEIRNDLKIKRVGKFD
jgi:hypothetical protein